MLKPKTTKVYSITTGIGALLDIILLEESIDINDYLKAKYPDMYASLTVKEIEAAELVSAYKTNVNRVADEENQQNYVKLLMRSSNADVDFDTSKVFDDFDNRTNSELVILASDVILGLLHYNRNTFLKEKSKNLVWLTVLGILSDYAEYLQKDIKVLQDKNVTAEARKAVIYDIISYLVVLKKMYIFTMQHGLYSSEFLDYVDGVRHHLEKIQ